MPTLESPKQEMVRVLYVKTVIIREIKREGHREKLIGLSFSSFCDHVNFTPGVSTLGVLFINMCITNSLHSKYYII
jgi:hypothetical protein